MLGSSLAACGSGWESAMEKRRWKRKEQEEEEGGGVFLCFRRSVFRAVVVMERLL